MPDNVPRSQARRFRKTWDLAFIEDRLRPLADAYLEADRAIVESKGPPDSDLFEAMSKAESDLLSVLRHAMPLGFRHRGFHFVVGNGSHICMTPLGLPPCSKHNP